MPIPNRDILQLLREANHRLNEDQSLTTIAQRAGWSKFHFLREFHRVTGESPRQYIERVRLQRAAAALNTSSRPVLDVALEAGFHSHEVFSRAFARQFYCSPSEYRQRSSIGSGRGHEASYESLVQDVSPCVGLFQITEKTKMRSKTMNEPDIVRVTLKQQPILFIRDKVDQSQLQPYFAASFGKLFGYGMRQGLPIRGQPIARYVAVGPGLWTVDCVLPLAEEVEGAEGLQPGALEGGAALKATHYGPYEELQETYMAIQTWMEKEGVTSRGAHWEQYVTDPGKDPDSLKWQTDICWPIQ